MKTYECKIKDESSHDFLRKLNTSFGVWVRKLFVKLYDRPVEDKNQLKREFLKEYGVSSTHYNSIKNHVDGIHRSRKELGAVQAAEIKSRIKYTEASIKKLDKAESTIVASIARIHRHTRNLALHRKRLGKGQKSKKPRKLSKKPDQIPASEQRELLSKARFKRHQKNRRLAILQNKSELVEERVKNSDWSVCFGTKNLQRKQHFLEENDYKSHADWLENWQFQRSNQSFWLGDSTENAGNRNVKLDLDNGIIRLTVPDCMRPEFGSHVTVKDLKFDSRSEKDIRAVIESKDPSTKSVLSYRILERQKLVHDHDKKGLPNKVRHLYLQISLHETTPPIESRHASGGIGVDLNCDHLAIGEVDRSGNPIQAFSLPINMENRTSEQITAHFGDHIKKIVAYAKLKNKPISIERLDFQKKKAALREIHGPKMARLLSSFAYDKFKSMMASRCAREGIKLYEVNPSLLVGLRRIQLLRLAPSIHQPPDGRICFGSKGPGV